MIIWVLINPADGGLPESTDVAGGWSNPHPLTLLQINSHVQKLTCRCPRGFPIMANLFRKIIVHNLSVGDRWTWPSQTCHKIRDKKYLNFSCRMNFYYWKMCFLFEHPKDISELMVKTVSFYLYPFLLNSSSKLAIYRQISVFSQQKMTVPRSLYFLWFFFRHETFANNILGILIERIGWILFR